jgi:hypothetical protein
MCSAASSKHGWVCSYNEVALADLPCVWQLLLLADGVTCNT